MIRKTLFVAAALLCAVAVQAQTLDEILKNYFENTGGVDKWRAIEGLQMDAKLNQQGMELPLTIVQLKDGRQMTSISFQGKEIKQGVYDGATLWGTNFMNMKAEKSDAEATENFKRNLGDFPDPFLDYAKKGYKAELMGKETVEGTETFKVKLTKKPVLVDGKEEENISYYFFDTDNFVPIMVESEVKSGPAKGMISQSTMSDYQEVSGLMMPFSMTQGVKGSPGQPITLTSIVVNPKVDAAAFKFPEEQK